MVIRRAALGAVLAVVVAAGSVAVYTVVDGGVQSATASPSAAVGTPQNASLREYLRANPQVARDLAQLKALPRSQRAAARKAYLQAHPDVVAELRQLMPT